MIPRMIRCLADAAALPHRGLERITSGWCGQAETYPHRTVTELVDRGYLDLYLRGTVAHVTDAGRRALECWREQQREALP